MSLSWLTFSTFSRTLVDGCSFLANAAACIWYALKETWQNHFALMNCVVKIDYWHVQISQMDWDCSFPNIINNYAARVPWLINAVANLEESKWEKLLLTSSIQWFHSIITYGLGADIVWEHKSLRRPGKETNSSSLKCYLEIFKSSPDEIY